MMLRTVLLVFVIGLVASVARADERGPIRFIVFGDMPYTEAQMPRVRTLIEAINRAAPDFVVHVGDIKDGSTPCTDERFVRVLRLFAQVSPPFVYTPGDNEWTDCHRPAAGGYDPEERLAALKRVFFTGAFAAADRALALARQQEMGFSENARWITGGVVFATLHVVGSGNHYRSGDPRAMAEFNRRDAANRAWLAAAFEAALANGAEAVVLFFHAEPDFADPLPGFRPLLATLAEAAKTFGGPVLLVHGDGHAYTYDRPLREPTTGAVLRNVVRLEVVGSPAVGAAAITIDPRRGDPFIIHPFAPGRGGAKASARF